MTTMAYWLLILPVALVLFITGAVAYVVVHTLKDWRKNPEEKTVAGGMWQAVIFVVLVDVVLLAGIGVGKFPELWEDSSGSLIGLFSVVFIPWLGYKGARAAIASSEPEDDTKPQPQDEIE